MTLSETWEPKIQLTASLNTELLSPTGKASRDKRMLKKLPLEMSEVEALKGLQNLNTEHKLQLSGAAWYYYPF